MRHADEDLDPANTFHRMWLFCNQTTAKGIRRHI